MENIAIIGASGFGREVASLLKRVNKIRPKWNLLGFYDDDTKNKPKGSKNEYGPILGTVQDLSNIGSPLNVVIAVASPKALKAIRAKLNNPLISFPNIIAPEAAILDEDNFTLGEGNILSSFSSISCNVRIGNFNILNNRVSFGHDVEIGDYNVFMTACRISGDSHVGSQNLFGVASIVIPGIGVDEGVTVSPGSVIIRNTRNFSTYVGNPAKRLNF
jgi:sugar O-acyltransferase (sialic acid O-acetyltransferase NeuD family)